MEQIVQIKQMGVSVSEMLEREVDAIRRALSAGHSEVEVTLSRETAEWFINLAESNGPRGNAGNARATDEVSPTEAAKLLRVSRTQIRKFMDEGKLVFRKVGTHHRIPLESIEILWEWERQQMEKGMAELSRLQNEIGLTE